MQTRNQNVQYVDCNCQKSSVNRNCNYPWRNILLSRNIVLLLYSINIHINISITYFFQNTAIYSIFFFFSIYFYQLEANYFTVLQWFLSYIDVNQPWIYMYCPSRSPPPTSLSTGVLWVFPMHQARRLQHLKGTPATFTTYVLSLKNIAMKQRRCCIMSVKQAGMFLLYEVPFSPYVTFSREYLFPRKEVLCMSLDNQFQEEHNGPNIFFPFMIVHNSQSQLKISFFLVLYSTEYTVNKS